MALRTTSRQGEFCWSELCSSDWEHTKPFYTALFQWGHIDQPIGEIGMYTLFQKNEHDIGAIYKMMPAQKEAGLKSHWLSYIAVDDVDMMADKAVALGAELLAGPHEVPEAGRMAMLQDPSGAQFALWQSREHIGSQRVGEYNTPYWYELACCHLAQSQAFYCALFNWSAVQQQVDGMDYVLFCQDDKPVAGMLEMTDEWAGIPPHWMTYFAVKDCSNTVEQATALGGQVCVPETTVSGVGKFAVFTDPSGAVFSVMEPSAEQLED